MTIITNGRRANTMLWIAQALLAALFLFAGVTKLVMPIEMLTEGSALPGWFMRFIGVAETAGAFGLVLPGLFRIGRILTPVAASGLVVIMVGATALTFSVVPALVGITAAAVAVGRAS
jgi:hypothetical protein